MVFTKGYYNLSFGFSSVEDCEEMTADIVHSFLMPEMNRIYQRQRMDALQNRYMRASHDVTHSVCIAQGIVREVIDALGPAIQTHFSFGKAAIDGSQIVVDEVIREAVENILPQGPGLAPPPTSCKKLFILIDTEWSIFF